MQTPAHQVQGGRRPARTAIAGVLVGALLGGIAGFAVGLLVHPYLPLSLSQSEGSSAQSDTGALRATGAFVQADPGDRLHYGSGRATVYERLVRLGEDFAVGPGPKYHLYLVPAKGLDPDTRIEEGMFVDLGPLRDFAGGQDYSIPAGVDLADFGALAVWSEQLNVLISPAELSPAH